MLHHIQKSRWLLVIPFLLTAFTLYLFNLNNKTPKPVAPTPQTVSDLVVPGYLVHTPGCRIPEQKPFDDAILPYYKKVSYVHCGKKRNLVESNQTSIWIVDAVFSDYGIENVDCCYQPFRRKRVKKTKQDATVDNGFVDVGRCVPFRQSANIRHEFIKVVCTNNGTKVYTDYHAFIVPKTPFGDVPNESSNVPEGVSMLVIGEDSVSRANFYRHMPKTQRYLKELNAIDFAGYNKVHDNTFPNMVPVLSGFSVTDLKHMCWFRKKTHFDGCPWIWKKLSANGYLTAFGEDSTWTGIFTYLKSGFLRQPTDYYTRTFMKRAEDESGRRQEGREWYCMGGRFASSVLMDYVLKFAKNMTESQKKFWGFFMSGSLTHDYLNFPSNADDLYHELLKKLNKSGVLNSTVVFLLSDHGMRWGEIRETYQGRMEERLPFLFAMVPEWLQKRYPTAMANMRRNARLLTTHFDLHETMTDLIDLSRLEELTLKKRMDTEWNQRSGVSLFLPISVTRTCMDAGISSEWCTCHQTKNISEADPKVVRAAAILIGHINELLNSHIQCASLSLKKVISARYESVSSEVINGGSREQTVDYIVVVASEPGEGRFESVVRHKTESDVMYVQGYVSRVNEYGKQSWCVNEYYLRLYCYCL